MKKLFIMVIIAVTGSHNVVRAQQPTVTVSDKNGWQKIGESTVDFTKQSDEINVIGPNRFSSLKFKVTNTPVELVSMDIYFDGGEKQSVKIDSQIKSSGESRVIDLIKGNERDLKKIVYTYKALPDHKIEKAHIEIWGLKTNVHK
ncbi:MAG: hypothetical protein ACXVPU_01625 [Bacteroidia bacterium]